MPPASGDTIRRNFGFALLAQLTSAAFTATLTLYLARELDPDGYGVFALALSIGLLALLPSDFGISQSASRFAAEHRGDRRAVGRVMADALFLKLAISGTICAALLLAAGPIADAYDVPELAWPLRAMAIAIFGQGLFQLYNGAVVATGRNALQLRLYAGESGVEFTASIGLVLLGAGAAGAAFGRAIGYGAGAVLGLVLLLRQVGWVSLPRAVPSRESRRNILGYATALIVIDAAFTAFEQVDVVFIGAYLGAASVGLFQAPLRLVTFLHIAGTAVANAVAPRVARNVREIQRIDTLAFALRWLTIAGAAIAGGVVAWAEPAVLLLLGEEYLESAEVLRALAPYVLLGALGPLLTLSVNFLGEAKRRIPLVLAAVAINVILDIILIPRIGIVGGAIATDVAYAVYAPAHLWILSRILHLPIRPLALTLARALLAAAALAGVLALVGTTGQLSVLEWVGGAAGGVAAFAVVLVLTGEVPPRDVRALLARARRRS